MGVGGAEEGGGGGAGGQGREKQDWLGLIERKEQERCERESERARERERGKGMRCAGGAGYRNGQGASQMWPAHCPARAARPYV